MLKAYLSLELSRIRLAKGSFHKPMHGLAKDAIVILRRSFAPNVVKQVDEIMKFGEVK